MDENKYSIVEVIRDYTSKENAYTTTYVIDEDIEKEYSQRLTDLGVNINDDNEV